MIGERFMALYYCTVRVIKIKLASLSSYSLRNCHIACRPPGRGRRPLGSRVSSTTCAPGLKMRLTDFTRKPKFLENGLKKMSLRRGRSMLLDNTSYAFIAHCFSVNQKFWRERQWQ